MKIRTLLLAATAAMAASAAQAQQITFTPVANGSVTNNASSTNPSADTTDLDADGKAYRNIGGEGGTASARTTINPDEVVFRSGVAVSGVNASGTVTSGVNMNIYNETAGTIALRDFHSTIIPAGMGFFLQDRNPGANNVFLDTGPTTSATFGSLRNAVGLTPFAGASFDFTVSSFADDTTLYSLYGAVSLRFDGDGNLIKTFSSGFNDSLSQLYQYQSFSHEIHEAAFDLSTTLLWDWSATRITVPLSGLGNLGAYQTKTLQYRAYVNAWTKAPCINESPACLVAFSAFGDPIGRGGENDELGMLGMFSGLADEDRLKAGHPTHRQGFNGLGFRDSTISNARLHTAVPEPATWALMIGGFGLAGAALRRRRRTITA